jgi:signal transduction histidine kinase
MITSPATPSSPAAVVAGPIPLRVLLVEDRPSDAALVVHLLGQAGFAPEWKRVETEVEYLAQLDPSLDIILADYALPQFSGLEALRLLVERNLGIPFILITGTAGEEAAVSALHLGADDYLLKDRLARLGQAVTRALEQRTMRQEKERSERELRASELRLLNQERAARAEAEAAVRLRDEFVAIASHELRTPVTAIKCTAQLLLSCLERGPVKPADVGDRLRVVNLMTDRLIVLISDLLDVSRLRTGQLALRREPLNLAQLAEEVVNQQRIQVGSQFPLALQVLGELPLLEADGHRIEQVLTNVLENAVKYSPQGGQVEVIIRADGSGTLLSVSDRGIGLPAEARQSIFEPFGRAGNAQKRQLPGMGLGLYISRQIVEQHGGRIWADSAGEGTGTLVSIWLPSAQAQGVADRPSRMLIVDDEPAIRDSLGDALEMQGYECRRAANGQAALNVLQEWPADVIVLDLMMPVMDGWAFRRAQRATAAVRDIPVVILSAIQRPPGRDRDLSAAVTIAKPFELTEVFAAVRDILRNRAPAQ